MPSNVPPIVTAAKDRRKLRDAQHRSKSTTTAAGDTVSKETGGNSPSKRSPTKTPQPVQSIPTKVLLDDSEDERDDMPPLPKGFVTGSKKEAVELSSGMSSLASTPQPVSIIVQSCMLMSDHGGWNRRVRSLCNYFVLFGE